MHNNILRETSLTVHVIKSHSQSVPTRSISGGSFKIHIDRRNTNAGADENSAVTSVADIVMRAREYI